MSKGSKKNKSAIDSKKVKENIAKLYSIDKSLVPKYLDDLKKAKEKNQEVDKDNPYY